MYLEDKKYLEILSLKNNNYDDFETCYNFLVEKVNLWYSLDFKDDIYLIVKPVTEKYIKICKSLIGDSKLYDELRNGLNSLVGEILIGKNERKATYIYTITSRIHELKVLVEPETTSVEESPIPDIIIPDLSDRSHASNLITDAINIIRDCNGLKDSAKNRIIKFLTGALNELNSDRTNWTTFFGISTYTVKALIAASAILGGVESGYSLLTAKDKIEEATNSIMDDSINISRLAVQNVFKIENKYKIVNNCIVLPESIDKK